MGAKEIVEKIKESKKKKIKVYPQHVARASEIGHPCERYLVYSITHWDKKQPYGPELEFIFEGGRLVEDLAIKDFEDAGFNVYRPEPDKAIAESRPRITGHIDIRVDFGTGEVHTGEIKGLNVYDWQKLNTIDDFFNSRKHWIVKYPAQLMTYMYIKGEEIGFFYLKSIPRFQPKFIWVKLDINYMDSILKKTERVEKHVAEKTLPDPVENTSVCENCPFNHICLPYIERAELEFIDDGELLELLETRENLKEAASEYNEVDRLIKAKVQGHEKISVGDFLIIGKPVHKKGYTVKDSSYVRYTITKITEAS